LTIADVIRERGPMTVAAFMELALYDHRFGYYARAPQRSGRAGDFFTSVDVGPLFGELLEVQIAEMARLLALGGSEPGAGDFDLVEAGAGNGRLSADILCALRRNHRGLYERTRLHLAETSPAARAAQSATLGDTADRLAASGIDIPPSFEGVLIANELLDALPAHQVIMREEGLQEIYVTASAPGDLTLVEGPPSTPRLQAYLDGANVALEPGWRAEINLGAVDWIRETSSRLRRGFLILIDYGHEARELYSVTHAGGTLATFARHTMAGTETSAKRPPWLAHPGEQDITSHVDFTSVRRAAEAAGLHTLGFLDQTYFLLGLLNARGLAGANVPDLKTRLALKTLVMPGGLGSTFKVLLLGKNVGAPQLAGCSYRMRAT
jgi:SAM-dependent MidA family methyltransferase